MEASTPTVAQLHADRLNEKARGTPFTYSVLGAVTGAVALLAFAASREEHVRLPELLIAALFGLVPGFFVGRWRASHLRFQAKVIVAEAQEARKVS